jgi:hypothetical protein
MAEGMSITKEYVPITEKTSTINNTTDYFTLHTPIQNPVYKFSFDFLILVNGILQNNP